MKQVMMFAAIVVVTLAVHANPTQLSNCAPASREAKTLSGFDNDAAGSSNCNATQRPRSIGAWWYAMCCLPR